jgi:phosphatidylinositol glycan class W
MSVTIFAGSPWTLNIVLCVPAILLISLRPPVDIGSSPLPSHGVTSLAPRAAGNDDDKKGFLLGPVQQLAALTSWRAHMMLMTSICILAVDFQVFPRMLAKCETFGTGLVSVHLSYITIAHLRA